MLSKNNNKRFRGNQLGNRAGNASTMPDSPERKPALKLALFLGLSDSLSPAADHPPPLARSPKSPRSFDDGAVGLGIVAAMSGVGGDRAPPLARAAPPPPPARSDPIPIVSPRMWAVERPKITEWDDGDEEDDELSESYTCVISHVAGDAVKKRVYFDDGSDGVARNYGTNPRVFYQSPPPPPPPPPPLEAADFLSRCYLCRKNLHGLDIFMYRGDKAFCSAECRCQQIMSDEYRENCGYGAVKPFEYSVSPCSTPFFFAAGVAAA